MGETIAKESKRVTNEQLLEKLQTLALHIDVLQNAIEDLQEDVKELKKRTGFGDSPVTAPSRTNCNTDPGPWGNTTVLKK